MSCCTPGASNIVPSQTDTSTRLTRGISLNIPILSSAMDTVTEADMAIVMAQLGGIGVLHRNLTLEEQCAAVRQVKRFESGMVVNPITIHPDATLADAQALMSVNRISGIPVVEASGKLVGILTNRDVRFAGNPRTAGRRADDARRTSPPSRPASARTRRGGSCTSGGSKSCWWSTRIIAASG